MSKSSDDLMWEVELQEEVETLRAAIRKHRDEKGDDRCYLDDYELYKVLPEGFEPPKYCTAVELENCKRYIASRQDPNIEYVSPQREIERLTKLLEEKQ